MKIVRIASPEDWALARAFERRHSGSLRSWQGPPDEDASTSPAFTDLLFVAEEHRTWVGSAQLRLLPAAQPDPSLGLPASLVEAWPPVAVGLLFRVVVASQSAEAGRVTPIIFRLIERLAVEAALRGGSQVITLVPEPDLEMWFRLGFERLGGSVRDPYGAGFAPIDLPLDAKILDARGAALAPALHRTERVLEEIRKRPPQR